MKTSVALCTYNGERFIREQIDSILNQTQSVDEIVVCDDGSTDKTLDILEQYAIDNPNLFRIYKNEINLRSVKNFEKALQLCTGDILFLSDQDDIWTEYKVADYLNYFEKNPNINVIASNGYCIDENSKVHDKYSLWDIPALLREANSKVDYYKIIAYLGNIATGATMAVRKSFLKETISFPIIKGYHHDEWIALVAAHKNSFELLDKKYFYYRIHSNQQVGGVFFKKTKRNKYVFTYTYNLESPDLPFWSYKIILKKLIYSYLKNEKLLQENKAYSQLFKENLEGIKKLFYLRKQKMEELYPLKSKILDTSDRLFKKRIYDKNFKL